MRGATPGIYHLILRLRASRTLQIGRLGGFHFPAGYYVYTGSARNGLERRLARHHSTRKRLHWHIDYLLRAVELIDVVSIATRARAECSQNRRVLSLPGAQVPVRGFGSSDCRCPAHLAYFVERPDIEGGGEKRPRSSESAPSGKRRQRAGVPAGLSQHARRPGAAKTVQTNVALRRDS